MLKSFAFHQVKKGDRFFLFFNWLLHRFIFLDFLISSDGGGLVVERPSQH